MAEYKIPVQNYDALVAKLNKLLKRAKKHNLPAFTWKILRTESQVIKPHPDAAFYRPTYTQYYHIIEVEGVSPVIGGWNFVGTLDWQPEANMNLVLLAPNEVMPDSYRNARPHCEHCGINRYRKQTFIIRENSKFKQVGRACLKEYLNDSQLSEFLNQASFLKSFQGLFDEAEELGWMGLRQEELFSLKEFLSVTAAVIRDRGWLSKGKANEIFEETGSELMPTAEIVWWNLNPQEYKSELKSFKAYVGEPTEEDKKMASDAISFFVEKMDTDNSDYVHNVSVILANGFVKERTRGIAASIVGSYSTHLKKIENDAARAAAANASPSEHVGEIKQRLELQVTVRRAIEGFSEWMQAYYMFYIMADEKGNIYVWKQTSGEQMEEGKTYRLKATVKEHGMYNGIKQTVLTRGKIQAEINEEK